MKSLLLPTLLFTSLTLFSQGYNSLNPNEIKTGMHSNGSMFMSENFFNAGFQVPFENSGSPAAFFAGGIWLSGTDPSGNLKVASITYPIAGGLGSDYISGPYNAPSINFDFERVFHVTAEDINKHLEDFADGSIDLIPKSGVLLWPGSGNPNHNEALPQQRMASFFDQNQDGIYNAFDGDYPIVDLPSGGVVPTEMIYTIYYNVNSNNATATNLEVHSLMYGFASDSDEVLDNSIFNQLTIINRGFEDLRDFKFSYWIDPDLGCHLDDYTGCDPDRNLMYVYNGDQEDGDPGVSCTAGIPTYGDAPPVVSVKLLNQEMSSFMVYYNGGVNNPAPATTDPENADEVSNAMNGLWRDGTPITVGGNGYNPGSTDETSFVFSDSPNDPAGWSMYSQDLPFLDFRTLSTISKDILQPGETIMVDLVITHTNKPGFNHVELVDEAIEDADYIQGLYDNGIVSSTNDFMTEETVYIHPNPNDGNFTMDGIDAFDRYTIADILGNIIYDGMIDSKVFNLRLTPNVYFLRLTDNDDQSVKTLRFVVVE